jgi:hypothetical protein
MTLIEKRSAYQSFFLKNQAGQEFVTKIHEIITANHTKAETDPNLARDYVQRAKGAREVIEHIQSLTAEKKGVAT